MKVVIPTGGRTVDQILSVLLQDLQLSEEDVYRLKPVLRKPKGGIPETVVVEIGPHREPFRRLSLHCWRGD